MYDKFLTTNKPNMKTARDIGRSYGKVLKTSKCKTNDDLYTVTVFGWNEDELAETEFEIIVTSDVCEYFAH